MKPPRRRRLTSFALAGTMIVTFALVGVLSLASHHPAYDFGGAAAPGPSSEVLRSSATATPDMRSGDATGPGPGGSGMSAAALSARPGLGPVPAAKVSECPSPTITVHGADELSSALDRANPGDVIFLADGTYTGHFTANRPATPDRRIYLCGNAGAFLDGGGTSSGYVLHLDHADYWVVSGLTIRNGQKGVVADTVKGAVLQRLTVSGVGQEGIHLRKNTTGSLVIDTTVKDTGKETPDYGEGIYIGTAVSNWCSLTSCRPDESNFNMLARNTISATTAENIDIKEGTIGGVVSGNTFSGDRMTASDAWVNVKGNAWTIESNTGSDSPRDGFQTHNILLSWGDYNLFKDNTATISGRGEAIAATPPMHNIVACSNKTTGARRLSNVKCTNP